MPVNTEESKFIKINKCGYAADLERVSNLTTKMAYCSWQGLFIALVGEDLFNATIKIEQLVDLAQRSDSPFMMLAFNVAKSNIMMRLENYDLARTSGQTQFYLANLLADKSDQKGAFDLLNQLHTKFQKWDLSVWQQKCEQELEPYRF